MPLHQIGKSLIGAVAMLFKQFDVRHPLNPPRLEKADKGICGSPSRCWQS
jgi:hypothetical protein